MCLGYRNVQRFGLRRPSHSQQEHGEEGGDLARVRASLFREVRPLQIAQAMGENLAWDCQRHDTSVVYPVVGANAFQTRDNCRRGIVRNRKGLDGGWLEILKEAHRWLAPKRETGAYYIVSAGACLGRSLPEEHLLRD
jgi:hypothetical protein